MDRTVTSLEDTWDMVTRRVQMDMQVLELNDQVLLLEDLPFLFIFWEEGDNYVYLFSF